jgi:hypothetical protein
VVVFAALIVASQAVSAGPALAYHRTHLGTHLYGTSHYSYARGHAEYGHRCGGYREFDVHMWDLGRLHGSTLVVFAAGHKVGSMRVRRGRCHLYRRAHVPRLSAGDVVAIRTSGGKLVAKGTLRRMGMM